MCGASLVLGHTRARLAPRKGVDEMQYYRIGDDWAAEPEFYDERKGYHGNRDS